MTFPVGKSDILFDGFIDWVVNDAGSKSRGDFLSKNLHIVPQIKYDRQGAGLCAGQALCRYRVRLLVEQVWPEDGSLPFKTDQNTFSAIVKAHF